MIQRTYFSDLLQRQLSKHKNKLKDPKKINEQSHIKKKNLKGDNENVLEVPITQHKLQIKSTKEKQNQSSQTSSNIGKSLLKNGNTKELQIIDQHFIQWQQTYKQQVSQLKQFMFHTLMNQCQYNIYQNMMINIDRCVKNMVRLYRKPQQKANRIPIEETKEKKLGYKRLNSNPILSHNYQINNPYNLLEKNINQEIQSKKPTKPTIYMKKQSLQINLKQ